MNRQEYGLIRTLIRVTPGISTMNKLTEKIWLPPLELCCKDVPFHFLIHYDKTNEVMPFSVHVQIDCKKHGKGYILNPFIRSKHEIKFLPTKRLKIALNIPKEKPTATNFDSEPTV